ncbi:hypothetical protein [Streptomyces adustus]
MVPEFGADAVADFLGGEAGFACVVEADLFGDLFGGDEVLGFQGDAGDPAALQACRVDEPVCRGAQIVVVRGRFGEAAGLVPGGAAGEAQRRVRPRAA